jgi:YbbR domain-containing protein
MNLRIELRAWVLNNWALKLLSLVLSLTLWFYVTSTGKTELTLTVPVELRNIPVGMTVVGDVTGNLEVRMQGQERVLRDSSISKKVVALLDLAMTHDGENMIRISPDDIKRPAGTLVTHLSQTDIKVRLERLVIREFRVTPVLLGPPPAGYRLAGTSVTPARIALEGPASVMNMISRVHTMPIDIQKATQSITVEPRIDYQGKPVKLMEKSIAVKINIERAQK